MQTRFLEYVFLSRGIPGTAVESISSDEEQESDNYDTAPESDTENLFQERRTKVTSLKVPLEGVRDPISAHCSITNYGAPAGEKRHSNPGDYITINDPVLGRNFQGPQVRYADLTPSPLQASILVRGEKWEVLHSGEDRLIEKERVLSETRESEIECNFSPILV